MRIIGIVVMVFAGGPIAYSQQAQAVDPEQWAVEFHQYLLERSGVTQTPILVLGTFHFEGSTSDESTSGDMNMLSPRRQREIEEVVDLLATFNPTKVAVEWRRALEESLTEQYRRFVDGDLPQQGSEIYQLGFRLAQRCGLDSVSAVDVDGRWLEPRTDLNAFARKHDQQRLLNDPFDAAWHFARSDRDEKFRSYSLRDVLLFLNSPTQLRDAHSVYLMRKLALSDGEDYPGADGFVSQWYNRNLRIYGNVLRLIAGPDERIVFIFGSGHAAILRHMFEASLHFELVEVADVVGRAQDDADAGVAR